MDSVFIVGFGNFAKAWALNLRDSGRAVTILLREGSSSACVAREMGLNVASLETAELKGAQEIAILCPDHAHLEVLRQISPRVSPGTCLYFPHGDSLCGSRIARETPEINLILLAPKCIGVELRWQYETKGFLGGVYSLEFVSEQRVHFAWEKTQRLAQDLGIHRHLYASTFQQETQADLFSEQALLCGLMPYAACLAYNTLREKGIPKELAYLECWHELGLIASVMAEKGPADFFDLISPNALLGSEFVREELTEGLEEKFEQIWKRISDGSFKSFVEQSQHRDVRQMVHERWQLEELQSVHRSLRSNKEL